MSDFEDSKFNEIISKGVVLIDFYATWCGPCKMLQPELEELVKRNKDIVICKVDVDKHSELSRSYGIMSVPTLMLYKDGSLVKKMAGYMPVDALMEWIG